MTTSPIGHAFYRNLSLVSLTIVILGFGNFYGAKLINQEGYLSTSIHIHAALFMTWMLFFVNQTVLVSTKKTALHMKLGKIGFFLSLAMLISAIMTAVEVTNAGHQGIPGVMFSTPKGFLILNINSAIVFTSLVMAGLYFKRSPETHKRLMLMATVMGLVPPGISRLPGISGNEVLIPLAVTVMILLPAGYELVRTRKVHKAYLFSLPLVVLILPPVVEAIAKVF